MRYRTISMLFVCWGAGCEQSAVVAGGQSGPAIDPWACSVDDATEVAITDPSVPVAGATESANEAVARVAGDWSGSVSWASGNAETATLSLAYNGGAIRAFQTYGSDGQVAQGEGEEYTCPVVYTAELDGTLVLGTGVSVAFAEVVPLHELDYGEPELELQLEPDAVEPSLAPTSFDPSEFDTNFVRIALDLGFHELGYEWDGSLTWIASMDAEAIEGEEEPSSEDVEMGTDSADTDATADAAQESLGAFRLVRP